jgi:hypothetical protein
MSSTKRKSMAENNPLSKDRLDKLFRLDPQAKQAISESHETGTQAEANAPDPLRQTSFLLPESSIEWLDEQCLKAKRGGGKAIHKAAIVRALIELAKESGADLSTLKRGEEVKTRLASAIGGVSTPSV